MLRKLATTCKSRRNQYLAHIARLTSRMRTSSSFSAGNAGGRATAGACLTRRRVALRGRVTGRASSIACSRLGAACL